jgi:hypothetical protein
MGRHQPQFQTTTTTTMERQHQQQQPQFQLSLPRLNKVLNDWDQVKLQDDWERVAGASLFMNLFEQCPESKVCTKFMYILSTVCGVLSWRLFSHLAMPTMCHIHRPSLAFRKRWIQEVLDSYSPEGLPIIPSS